MGCPRTVRKLPNQGGSKDTHGLVKKGHDGTKTR